MFPNGTRIASIGFLPGGRTIDTDLANAEMPMTQAVLNTLEREPALRVFIKHRTKDHPSDDFKLVVNYEVELSRDE